MKYQRHQAGEWIQPIRLGYKFSCCDCGLVHKMDFRIVKGRVQFRAFRDNRATAAIRWHKKRVIDSSGEATCLHKHYYRLPLGCSRCRDCGEVFGGET